MPATTPSGWRRFQLSMPPPMLSVKSVLSRLRDAAGEFHHLDAARHFALGIGKHLAMLARDQRGQVVGASSSSLNLNRMRARRSGGVSAQAGPRLGGGAAGGRRRRWRSLATRAATSPVAGLNTSAGAVRAPHGAANVVMDFGDLPVFCDIHCGLPRNPWRGLT
jgi:hypothetical protein